MAHQHRPSEASVTESLAHAYGEQLQEIGEILVRAGVLTEAEIRRQGVRFAVSDRFEPLPAPSAKAMGRALPTD